VLHLSQTFAQQPERVQALLPEGVYVNPTCLPTTWGDLVHVHNSNVSFARTRETFDYVLLQASNDMYIRPGVGAYMAKHDAGFNCEPIRSGMYWGMDFYALRDPALAAIAEEIGTSELFGSQVEGSFYNADLFFEMIAIIERHWKWGDGESLAREEIYYPTIAAHLLQRPGATPTIYSEATHSDITAGHIWRIVDGTYRETADSLSHGIEMRAFARYDYNNLYGVKRIARQIDDPLRLIIRGLARSERPRMQVRPPIAGDNAVVVADMQDLLEYPEGLWLWVYQFRSNDPLTLVVLAREGEDTQQQLEQFSAIATHAGLNAWNSPNVEVLVVPENSFEEAALGWSALARYEVTKPAYRLGEVPVFGPKALGGLRELLQHTMI
jgi:hypothetical protein